MNWYALIATGFVPMKEKLFADTQAKINKAVKLLRDESALGFDTETSGLDAHTGKIWSLQIGIPEFLVLIPLNGNPGRFNLNPVSELFENEDIVKIAHNLSFDMKVLWSLSIMLKNGWCTRVAESLLNAGLFIRNDLSLTLKRYFDVDLSKDERKDFYCAKVADKFVPAEEHGMQTIFELSGYKWTPELIQYALGDVEHLIPLMLKQKERLTEEQMMRLATKIEFPLVEVTAAIERRGVKMNREACKAYQEEMTLKSAEARQTLVFGDKRAVKDSEEWKGLDLYWKSYALNVYQKNKIIWDEWREIWEKAKKDHNTREGRKLAEEAKAKRMEYKLRQPFKTPPKPPKEINLNSSPQLLHAFAQAGVYLKNTQKTTLQEVALEHPLLELLVEYKKFKKLSEMSEIYNRINPVTGRLHQSLNQNVDTGRYSSSGPNLTNIPVRSDEGARFRKLFEAEEGNTLLVADYSAIELFILGIRSKDENINKALDNDLDAHCWTMSKFLDCSYETLVEVKEYKHELSIRNIEKGIGHSTRDIERVNNARLRFKEKFLLPELNKIEDLVKWVKTLRDYVKTLTYGIAYGLSAFGLSRRFHCAVEEAQRFIDTFFTIYPDIKDWLDRQADFAERLGYSKTASGRRRYYRRPKKPVRQDTVDEANRILKQQNRDALSLSPEELNELWETVTKRLWREYYQTINRIRRQAANHPVQGGSADITKLAMLRYEGWWVPFAKANGINYLKYGIVLTVHDELVVEVPLKFVAIAKEKLKWAMESSAKDFLGYESNIVVIPTETTFWKK